MAKRVDADALTVAERWLREGRGAALATVIDTWSSAPLPAGSQMVIDGAGEAHGSLAGGCVEGEVIAVAVEAIATGRATLLQFEVKDDVARGVGLACGGRMTVYVERIT